MSIHGQLKSISFEPITLNQHGKGHGDEGVATRGLPRIASADQARDILDRIVVRSEPFGTQFFFSEDRLYVDLALKCT